MKQKDILIIIILLFVSALAWIGGSIYHSAVTSTISEDVSQEILPIPPTFDVKTVEKLKTREIIKPVYDLGNVTPTPIVLPTLPPSKNASQEGKLLL